MPRPISYAVFCLKKKKRKRLTMTRTSSDEAVLSYCVALRCMQSFLSIMFFPLRMRVPPRSTLFPYTTLFRSAVSDKLLDLVGLGGKSAADKGKDTRDYLAAAFPELNAWERAGADASSAGMVDAGFENQKELTKMQLDNQKEIDQLHLDRKSGS